MISYSVENVELNTHTHAYAEMPVDPGHKTSTHTCTLTHTFLKHVH